MRPRSRAGRILGSLPASLSGFLLTAAPALPARALEQEQVAACDSLVALRQLAAAVHEDRARAAAQASAQAGCRLVPREAIGTVERRAMVGGAPYECLAVSSGGCLWVLP